MNMYEMKTVLRDTLSAAVNDTEADLLIGVISEQGTIVVSPQWEAYSEEFNPNKLTAQVARMTAIVSDNLGEGICLGLYVVRDLPKE